jgi:hypothetical protein
MGVSANLLINAKWNVKSVETLLGEGLGLKIIGAEHKGDHSFLRFEYEGQARQMYVARSTEYGGLDGTILSLNSDADAINLFKSVMKVTGGFLRTQDCDNMWSEAQDPHAGNARFVFEHQILARAIWDGKELSDAVAKATGYERGRR